MGFLAWLAGTAAIVALRFWEVPSFWLGVTVAVAVLFVVGGALATSGDFDIAGIPVFLALTGTSATTAAALHDLEPPWNGYLEIAAIVMVTGFVVTVIVASTFGIVVLAGEDEEPFVAMALSLIPGALGLISLIVDAIVDFSPTIDACANVGTVLLLSAAVTGLLSSSTALIGGEEVRELAPLVASFGLGGVAIVAGANVTLSEFEPESMWAVVPLLVAAGIGVALVVACLLVAVGVMLIGTLVLTLDLVRGSWAPIAALGVVAFVLDLVIPLPEVWESWDSLIPALLIPAGVLGLAAVAFLHAIGVTNPEPEAVPLSAALAGMIAGGTLAVGTLTAAVAFDPPGWAMVLLVLGTVAGFAGCLGAGGYAVIAPQPAPAPAPAPVPAQAPAEAPAMAPVLEPNVEETLDSPDFDELWQSFVKTAKAPIVPDTAEPVVDEPRPPRQPAGHRQLEGMATLVTRHWKEELDLGGKLNLLIQLAMLVLTMFGLFLTVILAIAA